VSGRHQYRVKTRGDRRRDGRANDCLVCSPYYPPHDGWAAWIKGRCVDNAVGLDGRQRRCARQPEVQSKVDVLGGLPAMAAYGGRRRCAGGTSPSRETDWENGDKRYPNPQESKKCKQMGLDGGLLSLNVSSIYF